MTLFVDTSALLALVDRDDRAHDEVVRAFSRGRAEALATHTYVIVETLAVARRRFGAAVASDLIDRVFPALDVAPVDADLHSGSLATFREAVESSVSLVDRVSFAFMRREQIQHAIAVDADFRTAGFETIP